MGYSVDQQILKLGQHMISDNLLIKQIPSEESFRYPERAVSFEDKKRVIMLKLCKRKFLLNLFIQDCDSRNYELV